MTVSLSSSFKPRPSASVISARRAAARTSTGGGFWWATTAERQNWKIWSCSRNQNLHNHVKVRVLNTELPCFEASLSHILPPAWQWPSCSWLLWRCHRTAADTHRGWRPGIHKSENQSKLVNNQESDNMCWNVTGQQWHMRPTQTALISLCGYATSCSVNKSIYYVFSFGFTFVGQS